MKKNWRNKIAASGLMLTVLLIAACKNDDHSHHGDHGESQVMEDLSKLIKSPNETVVASIKTVKAEFKSISVSIKVNGIVTYDTRNIYTIPSRIGGRLEKVYLKYPLQAVKKAQKVAEIYSPELITAQRELIFLLQNDSTNVTLIQSAKERLILLGATTTQISTLVKSKKVQSTFSIYSPYEGYIISAAQQNPDVSTASPQTASVSTNEMNDGMASTSTPTSSSILPVETLAKEGSYVASGQTLFKVVNPAALRVELYIPTNVIGVINKGGEVTLDFGAGDQQLATIDFIQPFFNEGQEFLIVRAYTSKTDKLHIGKLVAAIVKGKPVKALWVPKAAVLDLGIDRVVFIKENGTLKPKKVMTGLNTETFIEIQQGLSSLDEIAANAQYLVDSESFIKTKQ
jgi:membrane fusion protein, copper/silver efflux system